MHAIFESTPIHRQCFDRHPIQPEPQTHRPWDGPVEVPLEAAPLPHRDDCPVPLPPAVGAGALAPVFVCVWGVSASRRQANHITVGNTHHTITACVPIKIRRIVVGHELRTVPHGQLATEAAGPSVLLPEHGAGPLHHRPVDFRVCFVFGEYAGSRWVSDRRSQGRHVSQSNLYLAQSRGRTGAGRSTSFGPRPASSLSAWQRPSFRRQRPGSCHVCRGMSSWAGWVDRSNIYTKASEALTITYVARRARTPGLNSSTVTAPVHACVWGGFDSRGKRCHRLFGQMSARRI